MARIKCSTSKNKIGTESVTGITQNTVRHKTVHGRLYILVVYRYNLVAYRDIEHIKFSNNGNEN